ncbi:hypothetical protein CSIV_16865 [Microbacterium sp. CSI-V]|uniref:DUF6326 family protein n=1 Tax=unclassified Microbacterium TaxID=2609290 RepID=UPI00097C89F4|nr:MULTISPECIES: DUF6326 family protein [unclassified Microbacterium]MXS74483.1 hypothetical protein [Microbacterium sp. TL13]ONI63082.1 hypothetical protein CSIV_16865 [Microbacterium sp. CSI-V]
MTTTIPVQAKIAAAWTSFMFLYAYVDILNFFKPGVLAEILNGKVWDFEVSAPLLTVMLASVAVPALMVVLSLALPARANRITNLVVAIVLVPYSLFNVVGESLEWAAFYAISIGLEVALLAFILRVAWIWNAAGVIAPTAPESAR